MQEVRAQVIVGVARILQNRRREQGRLVVQHPVHTALVAVGGRALVVVHVQHTDVRAGFARLEQLLHAAQMIVEQRIIHSRRFTLTEGVEAAEHHAAHLVAGPFGCFGGAILTGPDVPDDAVEACCVEVICFHQVILIGVAMTTNGTGLRGQHLVLHFGCAGPQAVDIHLIVLIEVLRLRVVNAHARLGDLQVLAIADLRAGLDADAVQPSLQRCQHALHVQLRLHIEQVVHDPLAQVCVCQIIRAIACMIEEEHVRQVDEQE